MLFLFEGLRVAIFSTLSHTHYPLSQVVLQLRDINSQLDVQLSRLGSRSMQVAAAAAAGGSGGGGAAGGLGGLSSPLAAIPPGSAMAGALMMSFPRPGEGGVPSSQGLLASGGAGGGPGGSGGSGRGATLLRDDVVGGGSGSAAARGGPGGSLGGGTSSTVGLLGLGPLLGGDSSATVAATIMAVAAGDARAAVERWRDAAASEQVCVRWGEGGGTIRMQQLHGEGMSPHLFRHIDFWLDLVSGSLLVPPSSSLFLPPHPPPSPANRPSRTRPTGPFPPRPAPPRTLRFSAWSRTASRRSSHCSNALRTRYRPRWWRWRWTRR